MKSKSSFPSDLDKNEQPPKKRDKAKENIQAFKIYLRPTNKVHEVNTRETQSTDPYPEERTQRRNERETLEHEEEDGGERRKGEAPSIYPLTPPYLTLLCTQIPATHAKGENGLYSATDGSGREGRRKERRYRTPKDFHSDRTGR